MRGLTLFFLLLTPNLLLPKIKVTQPTSTFKIKSGATFITENQINDFKGTLVKEEGASISGNDIILQDGTFEDSESKMKMTGKLNPETASYVVLMGNDSFKGKRGEVGQNIEIRGQNNFIDGALQLNQPLVIQDHLASLTCALHGRMPHNIILNGGTVYLGEDLHFVDDMFFTGSGNILLNKRNLHLGSTEITSDSNLYFDNAQDIEFHNTFHLEGTWTFSNQNMIEGNGNIIFLEEGGNIVVEQGSSLLLKNMIIQKVSDVNIRCLDNSTTLSLQDVTYVQDGNYSFSIGVLHILGNFELSGTHTFVYESAQTSTIFSNAKLKLDEGLTFSFDPKWNSSFTITWIDEVGEIDPWLNARDFLAFQDNSSILQLKGSTLYVTTTGLKLKKGTLRFKEKSFIKSDFNHEFAIEEGLILGNNNVADDMICEFGIGSIVDVTAGAFSYKNINDSSWSMRDDNATLVISSGALFKVHQSIDFKTGNLLFRDSSRLARAYGKDIEGDVQVLGFVSNERCYNEADASGY